MMSTLKALNTRRETAEYFGVSYKTIERWEQDGKIVAVYPGKHPRYHISEIERLSKQLKNSKSQSNENANA